jgi:succinate dehydrogenase / fumarate reductase cytochrome b subunit
MKVDDRTYFTLKRLHSLTGVVPIGAFVLVHLSTNAKALQGPAHFDKAAAELAGIPFVLLIEAAGIWLPILFHMVLGLVIAGTAQANLARHGYARNWQYTLQRATGVLLLLFIAYHLWSTRFAHEYLHSVSAYQYMSDHLAHPGVFAFYALGVVATAYHLGNGLFGFSIHWGLATGRRAQAWASRIGMAVFVGVAALGLLAMLGFRGLRLDFMQKPHAQPHHEMTYQGGQR